MNRKEYFGYLGLLGKTFTSTDQRGKIGSSAEHEKSFFTNFLITGNGDIQVCLPIEKRQALIARLEEIIKHNRQDPSKCFSKGGSGTYDHYLEYKNANPDSFIYISRAVTFLGLAKLANIAVNPGNNGAAGYEYFWFRDDKGLWIKVANTKGNQSPVGGILPEADNDGDHDPDGDESLPNSPQEDFLSNSNFILYGPPGTGKTHYVQQEHLKKSPKYMTQDSTFITFHQSYSYEDFVEGIKPGLNQNAEKLDFEIVDGVFKEVCQEAYKLAKKNFDNGYENLADFIEKSSLEDRVELFSSAPVYTLCIDEINRGNVSAIFGELITLIEESKRLGKESEAIVSLPYSQKLFGVPPNLKIIGTMNTADRSVEALDTALRRRFVFKEMMPDPTLLSTNVNGVNLQLLLTTINKRIEVLLDRDHTIGHSYFIGVSDKEQLAQVFKNQVIPLLQEYFYNDYEKIAMVLGEGFVKRERVSIDDGFFAVKSDLQYSLNSNRWSINEEFDLDDALKKLGYSKDDPSGELS